MKPHTENGTKEARVSLFSLLTSNRLLLIGVIIILLFFLTAVFGPLLVRHDPEVMNVKHQFVPPSKEHLLGTDQFGRDVLSRIIYGTRLSCLVSLLSVGIAATAGVAIGLLAGYFTGVLDDILMRLMDIMLTFPVILLAIGLIAFAGPKTSNVIIAIGVVYTPQFARVIRSSVLVVRDQEYVEAAVVVGANDASIILTQILPNCLPVIIVQVTLSLAAAIILEAALSFLGLGTPPPAPSWGRMLSEARNFISLAPWNAVFPGISIITVVMGLNFIGDGIRDILDPKLRHLIRSSIVKKKLENSNE